METAIKKARQGGYTAPLHKDDYAPTLLDPLFWQALVKVLPIPKIKLITHGNWDEMANMSIEEMPMWKYLWHNFIEHISDGKPIDDFFNNLLK
tara:strand:- start:955 stop:1233 length:279 start_codon:yes stop_codon:yes gene_type:complete